MLLWAQTEKQRIIWAYKILFLDVLFPLSLRKVIFADSDQISRADFAELWNLDMQACHALLQCTIYAAHRLTDREQHALRYYNGHADSQTIERYRTLSRRSECGAPRERVVDGYRHIP